MQMAMAVKVVVTVIGCVWVSYVLVSQIPSFQRLRYTPSPNHVFDDFEAYRKNGIMNRTFSPSDLTRNIYFDETGMDILVNLRIQKTGSASFNKHLWYDLDFDDSCTCREKNCKCLRDIRNMVLFSSEIDKWPCSVHPDWTVLQACVRARMDERQGGRTGRRYFYLTMLRDPVDRFLSEWLHVRRGGARWKHSRLLCNGHTVTEEVLPCFNHSRKNISLEEFYSCPHNLAFNRQTRMLANLSLVNCYNTSALTQEERNVKMFNSAKENVKNMAFFGITGYQILSQILFENTFHLKFMTNFNNKLSTDASRTDLSPIVRNKLAQLNKYDILLYQFAKDLFFQRLDMVR